MLFYHRHQTPSSGKSLTQIMLDHQEAKRLGGPGTRVSLQKAPGENANAFILKPDTASLTSVNLDRDGFYRLSFSKVRLPKETGRTEMPYTPYGENGFLLKPTDAQVQIIRPSGRKELKAIKEEQATLFDQPKEQRKDRKWTKKELRAALDLVGEIAALLNAEVFIDEKGALRAKFYEII